MSREEGVACVLILMHRNAQSPCVPVVQFSLISCLVSDHVVDITKHSSKCTFVTVSIVLSFSNFFFQFSSVQFSFSVGPTLCDRMNHSTPGLPIHHQIPEFTQTHVHQISDAIQPSHPRSSPSPPAPNLSQHQSLFQ